MFESLLSFPSVQQKTNGEVRLTLFLQAMISGSVLEGDTSGKAATRVTRSRFVRGLASSPALFFSQQSPSFLILAHSAHEADAAPRMTVGM